MHIIYQSILKVIPRAWLQFLLSDSGIHSFSMFIWLAGTSLTPCPSPSYRLCSYTWCSKFVLLHALVLLLISASGTAIASSVDRRPCWSRGLVILNVPGPKQVPDITCWKLALLKLLMNEEIFSVAIDNRKIGNAQSLVPSPPMTMREVVTLTMLMVYFFTMNRSTLPLLCGSQIIS